MNYHNITKDDMLNGDGLRAVLWVAGCNHKCKECQNPITWDPSGGLLFYDKATNTLKLKINGVVYNEMKGAYSEPLGVLGRYIMHSLYKNNTYQYESGGDPKEIPNLSYEDFKKFHSNY